MLSKYGIKLVFFILLFVLVACLMDLFVQGREVCLEAFRYLENVTVYQLKVIRYPTTVKRTYCSSTSFVRNSTINVQFPILTLHGSVADLDPACHFDEDPDTDPTFHSRIRILACK